MLYEIKFGLIGFVVGTVAISATTFASNRDVPLPVSKIESHPIQALLPSPQPSGPAKLAEVPVAPMSEWRRAYIAKHGHQPPVPPS